MSIRKEYGSVKKREINAKNFMRDVKAGRDDVGLMKKYRLTPRGLDSTFRKLLTLGLISRFELAARRSDQEETVDLAGIPTEAVEQDASRRKPETKTRYVYAGKVEGIDILDYIQWMLIDGRQTVVEVRHLNGTPTRLFVSDGKVLHATAVDLDGEEAFYRCVLPPIGEFEHLLWSPPERITIEKAGMQLLFEAARRRDEANYGLK
jgi:hypothetical protein